MPIISGGHRDKLKTAADLSEGENIKEIMDFLLTHLQKGGVVVNSTKIKKEISLCSLAI